MNTRRWRSALVPLVAIMVMAGCSSTDGEQPERSPRSRPMRGEGSFSGGGSGLALLPPPDWWHDGYISGAVGINPDQIAALDRISADQAAEIARLDRDMPVSDRELRDLLASDKPTDDDIIAAGGRLRGLRDALFDRQIRMLAAERSVLTRDQWQKLEDALQTRRSERNDNAYPRRGGRGGFGGRGRGFPG